MDNITNSGLKSRKVLGVTHLVIAVIGIGMGVYVLSNAGAGSFSRLRNMVIDFGFEKVDQEVYDDTLAQLEKAHSISNMMGYMRIVLGLLLGAAGVFLLKGKSLGKQLTIGWSVARIVAALVLAFLTVSALNSFNETLSKMMEAATGKAFDGGMKTSKVWLQAIAGMIYPALCLFLFFKKGGQQDRGEVE